MGYARGLQLELQRNEFRLSAYLPDTFSDSIEWSLSTASLRDVDSASVRDWDSESEIAGRQGASKIFGELLPTSRKIRLGEEERLRIASANAGSNQPIIDAIYNDTDSMVRAVLARIERMRGEVLQTRALTFDEGGVKQTVTFPSTLAAVTASIKWDQVASAVPISDLTTWTQAYIDTNGVAPGGILGTSAIIGWLLQNASIRALLGGVSGAPAMVSVQALSQVFQAYGLPPIVPYDTKTRVSGTATRVTHAKKITFLPPAGEPLGETRFGPTAEALELSGEGYLTVAGAPGLAVVIDKTTGPVSKWTECAAVAMPLLGNADLVFTATVLT